jgi:hypothetical protein
MPDEQRIRALAREILLAGKLPWRAPDSTWGGNGVGAPCAVCRTPIAPDQVEYEIQFAHDAPSPGLDKYFFHIRCFAAWEMERTKLGTPLAPTRLHRGGRL